MATSPRCMCTMSAERSLDACLMYPSPGQGIASRPDLFVDPPDVEHVVG